MNPDLLPGTLHLLILRALTKGPLHGYAVAKWIKESSSDVLVVEEGSLYPALQRMLLKGWVQADWGISETNRKARFYRLTPEGRRQLRLDTGDFRRLAAAIHQVLETA